MITIYTDGSSKGNPGPGGWGAIIFNGENVREMGDRKEKTTNNRMEMMAAIEALKYVSLNFADTESIEVHSDSTYLINGITVWIRNWQKNNWRTKDKREVLNKDLWQELLGETEKRNVEWKKVLGHSGHQFNERCDEIAQSFADGLKVNLYEGSKSGYFLVS
jgi:ribonuclease HI